MHNRQLQFGNMTAGPGQPMVLIAGPCVLESERLGLEIAGRLQEITAKLGIQYIFKASYDKANRSAIDSFRGPGLDQGLACLQRIKQRLGVALISDVHGAEQVPPAAEVLDILQIPAFLCRQTDLLLAAGRTGLPVNVKKGQFLAPWEMGNVVAKIASTGNRQILLTERGSCFGYNNLTVDFRSIPIMQDLGCAVIFDATHSVQLPGGEGNRSGGQREYAPTLARAAMAAGADGIFMEVHPDPDQALCDGPNAMALDQVEGLLKQLLAIREAAGS